MNGNKYFSFSLVFLEWMIVLLAGCAQSTSSSAPEGTIFSPQETVQATPISSGQGDATPMIQPFPTPSDPALQGLIQKTREDLAQRLSILITQISLVEATEVEWSDTSLGCPQPDMAYLEVITPGYRILLQADTTVYEYHSNKDAYFVYCENPGLPSLPKP